MSNRRTFINQAGLVSAGILFAPKLFSKNLNYKPGIQLYSVRDQIAKDVKGVIAKVAKAGYQEVETYGYSPTSKFWGLSSKEFSELLKSNGLTSPSGHSGMDILFAKDSSENLKLNIESALIVGQQYVTIPSISHQFTKTEEDLKKVAEKMNKVGEICKKSGLKLAYHNHNFEWEKVGSTSFYQTILKETESSLVNLELDLYWAVRAGQDPIKLFNEHPGRFPLWHVKDMDKIKPEINTEIGTGSIDFKKIFEKAKLAGLKHVFMEQENYSMDAYQSIAQSCTYMKSQLLM